jgi:type VI secretion system protein ImpF
MDDLPPSFLDRLTDPGIKPNRCKYTLREFEARVLRDLQDLLNTKRPPDAEFADFPEIQKSVANYGLRDMTHKDGSDSDVRSGYANHIKEVIEAFEPRLSEVEVDARTPEEVQSQDPSLFRLSAAFFRIRVTLNVDPTPIDGVTFDTVLELASGQHQVKLPG